MTPCPTALSSSLHKNFTQIERRAMLSFRSLSSLMTNIPYAALLTILVPLAGIAQNPKLITDKSITLPPLGTQHNVGSLVDNSILAPGDQHAITTDAGFNQSLWSVDIKTGMLIDRIDYPNHVASTNGLFDGLAFAGNSALCAAQGANDRIAVVTLVPNGQIFRTGTIFTQPGNFPSGLAVDSRSYLYVAQNDSVNLSVASSVAIYSRATQSEVGRYTFSPSCCGTPDFPLAIATLSNGSRAYVASEGDGAVCDLNPTNPTLTGNIPTSANPDGLLLNKIQSLLYVSNGGSDTVFVVDTATDTVLQTFSVRSAGPLNQAGTPTPLGLSLSENGDPVCCLG